MHLTINQVPFLTRNDNMNQMRFAPEYIQTEFKLFSTFNMELFAYNYIQNQQNSFKMII